MGRIHHCRRRLEFCDGTQRRQTMITLTEKQRMRILDRVATTVSRKFYDPMLNGVEWESLVEAKRDAITRSASTEEFEKEITELLKALHASHVGFFHQSV